MGIQGKCEECGRKGVVHRHHKTYVPEVIEVLCPRCHLVAHGRADRGLGRPAPVTVPDGYEPIPWAEVKRQYALCFPRAQS